MLNDYLVSISQTDKIVATKHMEVNDPGDRRPDNMKQELLTIGTA